MACRVAAMDEEEVVGDGQDQRTTRVVTSSPARGTSSALPRVRFPPAAMQAEPDRRPDDGPRLHEQTVLTAMDLVDELMGGPRPTGEPAEAHRT